MTIKLLFVSLFSISFGASAAVLVDNRFQATSTARFADDGIGFREIRRVGMGLTGGGLAGMLGVNLELNLSGKYSFMGGYGWGSGFNSFNLGLKHVFGGTWFLPYSTVNLAQWFSTENGRALNDSSPALLTDKFLNDEERLRGEFRENLIAGGFGLQYVQLRGEWAGSSIFAEVQVIVDIDDLVLAPVGALGFTYYL